ncbi:MAG: PucR family transcriptional regulator [Gulosibacter sp.]|uniref:PucR family transcriptional regulator n=1 Tax=Gulosibacter sp. TaxID=2817531 RepID=UPI003F8DA632
MTLRNLLSESGFGLRLLPGDPASAEQLDAEISWVHSSDLINPTPWLEAGQLLLTDGGQFPKVQDAPGSFAEDAKAYAERLKRTGIIALGFAVNVVHQSVPRELVTACAEARLPLILVPSSTPFIRVIRRVADAIAEERNTSLQWSIRAQRAVGRATLRPDGLSATLRELESQLGCWVALYDAIGQRVPVRTKRTVPVEVREELEEAVAAQLRGGRRAATNLSDSESAITLQTIGQADRLRGVLAIGTALPLDPAGVDLVASVVGIASISIEQSRALDDARRGLRTGVMELYLAGSTDAAARALRDMNTWSPQGRIRVAVVRGTTDWGHILNELELIATTVEVAFARIGDELLVLYPSNTDAPLEFVAREGLRAGISGPVGVRDIPLGRENAQHAVRRADHSGEIVDFERLAERGMLSWLDAADGRVLAERILVGLRARPDSEELMAALRAWYEHNCAWDPAARELGMHRHTLRSRIALVQEITGLDLESFSARAELWLALELAD